MSFFRGLFHSDATPDEALKRVDLGVINLRKECGDKFLRKREVFEREAVKLVKELEATQQLAYAEGVRPLEVQAMPGFEEQMILRFRSRVLEQAGIELD